MFVPKPATYISYEQTQSVTFSRVGGAVSALSTFDITVVMKNNAGSSQFSNINREDLKALESFFKLKNLRVKNEIDEDANLLAQAMRDQEMDTSEDDAGPASASKDDKRSDDEDEESVDEDFEAESESEVAEEYDSNHESSGSGSGESDVDDDDQDERMEDVDDSPPKKKKKSS